MNKKYPTCKPRDEDEGRTTLIIDSFEDRVIIQFAHPVRWVGFGQKEAYEIGSQILRTAMEMKNVDIGTKQ